MADDESHAERLDRELIELLNGLRVILPGAQVLFAFLLTVPFTDRFPEADTAQRSAYFAGFLCTAIASALLLAPSAYHRLRWRQRDKEQLLRTANRLVIAALGFLAVAITAAAFLVTNLLYGRLATSVVSAGVALLLVWFWYGLPLSRRVRDVQEGDEQPDV
jgi:drug/metabolite transporter (DMT)-like permease